MTLQTWKDEFYPNLPRKSMTKKVAIEHSLQKWRGLTKANLKKHKIEKFGDTLADDYDYLRINTTSCALCKKYLDEDAQFTWDICRKCPFRTILGEDCDMGDYSPYSVWLDKDDPKPMIKALETILKES